LAVCFRRGYTAQIKAAVDALRAIRKHSKGNLRRIAIVRHSERRAFVIHHQDCVASSRLATIDNVAGKNPRVAGNYSIGRFAINADSVQTPV
jgi:hypothetical protein